MIFNNLNIQITQHVCKGVHFSKKNYRNMKLYHTSYKPTPATSKKVVQIALSAFKDFILAHIIQA